MKRQQALLLAGLCLAGGQACAGLFSDDEARQQIQQVGTRVSALEEAGKQQAETNNQQAETNKQQTRSMLDLQTQIEAQKAEMRTLRGQNEELAHELQDAEKRQKDFYIDLDTRVRHFETIEANPPPPPPPPPEVKPDVAGDLAAGNRAFEAAYRLARADDHQKAIEAFQDFLKKYPESAYVPDAHYELGDAYFATKDYKDALESYRLLVSQYVYSPKVPDAMLNMADCQEQLKDKTAARKTLKQIIAKYPGSEAASKAKERLAKPKNK
jgi:tol-pal system protein YbgF